jgi:hypothetical protein
MLLLRGCSCTLGGILLHCVFPFVFIHPSLSSSSVLWLSWAYAVVFLQASC